jgi:hypothetical protein
MAEWLALLHATQATRIRGPARKIVVFSLRITWNSAWKNLRLFVSPELFRRINAIKQNKSLTRPNRPRFPSAGAGPFSCFGRRHQSKKLLLQLKQDA